jgi:AcrR family transcriptional regulator
MDELHSLLEINMMNVRVLKPKGADQALQAPRQRKKPVQSRAQVTLGALQEAFVRVLIERGFEKMTIREVVSVAGVGIGTFYDYVPNLRALGATTIHQRCLESALVLRAAVTQQTGQSAQEMVAAMLQALVQSGFSRPKEWTALLMLERQLSSASALRKVHEEFVEIWAQGLRQSSAVLPEAKITSLARTAHALSYGWYSHDLLFYFDDPQHSRSIEEIATAIVDLVRANTRV